ncbi:metal-sulfur cluster assembly factor [Rhizobacter sp. SG703]|uniref:metal-sulfur cluster assembly factor n=1 Tax=Rhizobacter sp. SG703 TaxID=2587140 RepID=UPI001444AED0|nr:metal-sulfur cluster assembly factor [Rhizobacter sp. SG703]NKI94201.1 metal-sulfur cluster biosynthetic enzyme [Rhizobacter sp. SG703]
MNAAAIDFDGPEALRKPLQAALARVVDPELALSITDLGLVYGLHVDDAGARVRMTMTSPACPVIDLIVEDVENELDRVLPAGCAIAVEVCWEPAWTPDRMSERARRFLQR